MPRTQPAFDSTYKHAMSVCHFGLGRRMNMFRLQLRTKCILVSTIALAALFFETNSGAQTTFSSIVGTVVDQTNGSVPEVKIVVTNQNTGVSVTTSTAPNGNYLVEKLLPGIYMVSASKEGFQKLVDRNLVLEAQQTLRVDITLQVGAVTTQVMVTGKAPIIETESGQLSFTRSAFEIDALPVITTSAGLGAATFATNDPMNYVFSLPGAGAARASSAGKITIDGSLEGNTMVRVDGLNIRDNSNGISQGGRPMLQATEELKVIGVDAPAEFDMPATVLISTKGGTNIVHGGFFYEGQQSILNARNFFLPSSSREPFSRRNDIGAYIGGPFRKNKLFYFGSWELERSLVATTLVRNLPLPDFETGDFSALIDPTFVNAYLGGTPIVIRDPLNNGAPFPQNKIPASRLNPVSQAIQHDFYNTNPGLPGLSGNDVGGATTPRKADKFDIRVDYARSERHQMFAHFSYGDYSEQNYYDGPLLADVRVSDYPTREISASDTYSITPHILNEFKGGFFRYVYSLHGATQAENKDWQTGWGIQQFGTSKNLPTIDISSFSAISSLPPIVWTSQSWELLDNVTFLKGVHTLKVGLDFNRPRLAFVYDLYTPGQWSFSNNFTGYSYADFLLGYPSSTVLTYTGPTVDTRSFEYSTFFQDTIEATRDLTLTAGLRWTDSLPATAKKDVLSNFDPVTQSVVLASQQSARYISPEFPTNVAVLTAGEAHFPSHSLRNSNFLDFAPRFDFAYRLFGTNNTVVRGGYGLFFAPYDLDLSNSLGTFGIFRTNQASTNLVYPGTTVPQIQFPNPYLPASAPNGGRVSYFAVAKDLRDSHYNQVHLGLEHAFGDVRLLTSYIGNFGSQDIGYDLNQAPLCTCVFSEANRPYNAFSTISFWGPGNVFNYNSLLVVAERQLTKGLVLRASYSWTKALTISENDNGDTGNTPQNSHDLRADYGNVSFTPRHAAKITYAYVLPFGQGRHFLSDLPRVFNDVVGGWQLNGIATLQTGDFFSPSYSGYDSSGTGTFSGRPDTVGNGTFPSNKRTIDHWFNAKAYACPGQTTQVCDPAITTPIGKFGSTGRNTLVGPNLVQWDSSVYKGFPIHGDMTLKVRLDAINLLNRPNFAVPSGTDITNPATVGQITSTVNEPRALQFGATFDF